MRRHAGSLTQSGNKRKSANIANQLRGGRQMPSLEIDGACFMHNVTAIEIERVTGEYSQFVRVKIRGNGERLSFSCWGGPVEGAVDTVPQVTITDKDEREPADAIDASDESDR
jgi:hypothetical protein